MSRRAFLTAAGGLVVAAGCGSNGSSGRASSDFVGLRMAGDWYATPRSQRFAFGLTKDDRFFDGAPATVAFRSPSNELGAREPTTLRREGLPVDRGIYETEGVFAESGVWDAEIEVADELLQLAFSVNPLPETLVPGDPALSVPSPTHADPLGTDPICTRDPECGLHSASLSDVVGTGRPVAVMFATPARCQTAICGPVLDLLLDVEEPFRDRIELVHVEIYRDMTSDALVPTVDAWTLPSEPWLFGIDGEGVVTARLGGAFDRSEVRSLLEHLADAQPQVAPEGI